MPMTTMLSDHEASSFMKVSNSILDEIFQEVRGNSYLIQERDFVSPGGLFNRGRKFKRYKVYFSVGGNEYQELVFSCGDWIDVHVAFAFLMGLHCKNGNH